MTKLIGTLIFVLGFILLIATLSEFNYVNKKYYMLNDLSRSFTFICIILGMLSAIFILGGLVIIIFGV